MSTQFSGSLQTKKKGELQIIAQELDESDSGTREELVKKLTRHLENNPRRANDPRFAGLFTSRIRQRSLQPSDVTEVHDMKPSRRSRAHVERDFSPVAEEQEERESTPPLEVHDVSMMLKRAPQSPRALPTPSPPRVAVSARNIPLPPTPAKSVVSVREAPEQQSIVQLGRDTAVGLQQYVAATRLVRAQIIFTLAACIDIIPRRTAAIGLIEHLHLICVLRVCLDPLQHPRQQFLPRAAIDGVGRACLTRYSTRNCLLGATDSPVTLSCRVSHLFLVGREKLRPSQRVHHSSSREFHDGISIDGVPRARGERTDIGCTWIEMAHCLVCCDPRVCIRRGDRTEARGNCVTA